MTYEQAKQMDKGEPVIYRGSLGDEPAMECKWVKLDYHPNGNLIGICVDGWGNERFSQ